MIKRSIVVFLGLMLFLGCSSYGDVGEGAYEYASALYSICNTKNEDRLSTLREQLDSDTRVSEQEKRWLVQIAESASAGNWEQAAKNARQMMMEQVEQ